MFKYVYIFNNQKTLGYIDAKNKAEVFDFLSSKQTNGNNIDLVCVKRSYIAFINKFLFRKMFKYKDMYIMFGFLHKFLSKGLSLDKSLKCISECKIKMSSFCLDVYEIIKNGKSFSHCFKSKSEHFPRNALYPLLLIDKVGDLDLYCQNLSDYYKNISEKKEKINKAMRYPLGLLSFFVFIFVFLVKFFIPSIVDIFNDMSLEIPMFLNCIHCIGNNLGSIGLVLLVIMTLLYYFNYKLDYIIDRLPIVGAYRRYRDFSFFYKSISLFINNGVHLTDAIKNTGNVFSNKKMVEKINSITSSLLSGYSLHKSFERADLDYMDVIMIDLYEKSGDIKLGFEFLAKANEDNMIEIIDLIKDYAQPLVLIFTGVLLGLIAYVVLSPIQYIISDLK
ncbi:type II secretion system F family protein [Candidatus Nesciobacter abundans]|nr:type II secretion system F family protein [Candidatus Nesciobacter abundans]